MMFRIPVRFRSGRQKFQIRTNCSSNFIRSTFIDYFTQNHGHKYIKSSPVVPLCDTTVPFVNAGMNQFKGVFLGNVEAPCPRAVNSQKCVRVGGKHNDLDVVGTDGHHHTFFEMLGNWSFGDYYKKEACQMAWDLLLGPYRLKPENLVVTYFGGDAVLDLQEDRECRDIWKSIGVPSSRIQALGASDNFWEMGPTGPCGPCTELHHVNADGSFTEIWNIVFIQYNREADGSVRPLRQQYVDTGLGLERLAALLQRVRSNYDTDLLRPVIRAIELNSKVAPYGGRFGEGAALDCAYRRLADHARMISVCLADRVYPATSLNLKQVTRRALRLCADTFGAPRLLPALYGEVARSLGGAYPELQAAAPAAARVLEHEEHAYAKMRANLAKKWRDLTKRYPEVEAVADVEAPGFALGYIEMKETMSKLNSTTMPAELVFKLHSTHGFQEDLIERVAQLNNLSIDKIGFSKLLAQHKMKHKIAFKEQNSPRGLMFDRTIEKLTRSGVTSTNDQHKYNYTVIDEEICFETLKTNLVAILNEDGEWIDFLEPCENKPYYLIAEDTNFYCEEGGQVADTGVMRLRDNVIFNVDSVFKICGFVFHKGCFVATGGGAEGCVKCVKCGDGVELEIDGVRRVDVMRNHTGVHLLNAAVRRALAGCALCQVGSRVTGEGLALSLAVYGAKVTEDVVLQVEELISQSIEADIKVETRVVDSVQAAREEALVTVPGEAYPETGLRLVHVPPPPLQAKELCCGTHVPSTRWVRALSVVLVQGAGGNRPQLHALTGRRALLARSLFDRAEQLELTPPREPGAVELEAAGIWRQLAALLGPAGAGGAGGAGGAPAGRHARCLRSLERALSRPAPAAADLALGAIAAAEMREAEAEAAQRGRRFVVHFVRCSYLMDGGDVTRALRPPALRPRRPALLLGCAGGVLAAVCHVPQAAAGAPLTAAGWLGAVLPVFGARLAPAPTHAAHTYAEMDPIKASLTTCEQLVQDAMRVAIKYAQAHGGALGEQEHQLDQDCQGDQIDLSNQNHQDNRNGRGETPDQNRQHN